MYTDVLADFTEENLREIDAVEDYEQWARKLVEQLKLANILKEAK